MTSVMTYYTEETIPQPSRNLGTIPHPLLTADLQYQCATQVGRSAMIDSALLLGGSSPIGSGKIDSTAAPCLEYSAYLSRLGRADERTRTADLLVTSSICAPLPKPKSRLPIGKSVRSISPCYAQLRPG